MSQETPRPRILPASGRTRSGDFYSLYFGTTDPTVWGLEPAAEGVVISAGPPRGALREHEFAYAEEGASPEEPGLRCPVDPAHVLVQEVTTLRFAFVRAGELPPVIADYISPVVRRAVADRLAAADLRGLGFCPVDVTDWAFNYSDEEACRAMKAAAGGAANLRHLFPKGGPVHPKTTVRPPAGNRCVYCGRAPVACPGCGWADRFCPQCGREPVRGARDVTPEEVEAGVIVSHITPLALQQTGVIDPRRWDGSDYMAGGVATRRFLDYLLSIHLWPFVAVPLPTLVEGLSKEELIKLDRARRPVVEGAGAGG